MVYQTHYLTQFLHLHVFQSSHRLPTALSHLSAVPTTPESAPTASRDLLPQEVQPQIRAPLPLPLKFPWTWTKLFQQIHCLPQAIHQLSAVSDATTTVYAPIASGYTTMRSQEITDTITPMECVVNRILPTIILMLPYDKY